MSRRVVLLPWEDQPRQEGLTMGPVENGVQMVVIDQIYRAVDDPDGIREVPVEQLRPLLPDIYEWLLDDLEEMADGAAESQARIWHALQNPKINIPDSRTYELMTTTCNYLDGVRESLTEVIENIKASASKEPT